MSVLIIAEHDNSKLAPSTLSVMSAAKILNGPIDILCAGYQCQSVVKEIQKIGCGEQILHVDFPCYEHPLAENFSALIAELGKNYTHIFAPATTFGKNILPRAAALLDVAQISDVCKIINENTYQRPIYAANALLTVRSQDPIQVATIRPTAFSPFKMDLPSTGDDGTVVKLIDLEIQNTLSIFVSSEFQGKDRPALSSASIVISGGRGLGDQKTFEILGKIATRMGAALGASRAAVDAGLVPNDLQVGQTGQIVAPKLYIAVGISGAIQHIAGMKDSKIILAINKDPDAAIFEIADYGLVADLHEVLKEWEIELDKIGH